MREVNEHTIDIEDRTQESHPRRHRNVFPPKPRPATCPVEDNLVWTGPDNRTSCRPEDWVAAVPPVPPKAKHRTATQQAHPGGRARRLVPAEHLHRQVSAFVRDALDLPDSFIEQLACEVA
jgi:hypothetical protein